jgi:hypothetical protein
LVDVSVFERKPEQGYGNTETDDSSAVKITQTYTDDSSDLVQEKAPEPVY